MIVHTDEDPDLEPVSLFFCWECGRDVEGLTLTACCDNPKWIPSKTVLDPWHYTLFGRRNIVIVNENDTIFRNSNNVITNYD